MLVIDSIRLWTSYKQHNSVIFYFNIHTWSQKLNIKHFWIILIEIHLILQVCILLAFLSPYINGFQLSTCIMSHLSIFYWTIHIKSLWKGFKLGCHNITTDNLPALINMLSTLLMSWASNLEVLLVILASFGYYKYVTNKHSI